MRSRILTYAPPGRGRKKGKNSIAVIRTNMEKPIKQYRRRRLPYISPDLKWMCLWMALLLGVVLAMTVADAGAL